MKNYARFTLLIGCALMVFAGCSGGTTTTTTDSGTPATSTPTTPQTSDVGSFTGTYEMNDGEEAGEEGTLQVDETNTGIRFHLTANIGNAAEAEFSGNLEEDGAGGYIYPDDACQIGFKFTADGCDVKYVSDPIGCGFGDGAADVAGHYAKASSERPKF